MEPQKAQRPQRKIFSAFSAVSAVSSSSSGPVLAGARARTDTPDFHQGHRADHLEPLLDLSSAG
jgi:hypothetical protein